MRKALRVVAITVLLFAVTTMALVPSVRAQVMQVVTFRILGADMDWMLYPAYITAGLQQSMVSINLGKAGKAEMKYHHQDQFVVISEEKVDTYQDLPAGRKINLNSHPGVIEEGLAGEVKVSDVNVSPINSESSEAGTPAVWTGAVSVDSFTAGTIVTDSVSASQIVSAPIGQASLSISGQVETQAVEAGIVTSGTIFGVTAPLSQTGVSVSGQADPRAFSQVAVRAIPFQLSERTLTYQDARKLTWYQGKTRIEILSNLPEAELLKIAASMSPGETGKEN